MQNGLAFAGIARSVSSSVKIREVFPNRRGDSIVRDSGFPPEWSEGSHVVWKVPLTGRGWSQPVTAKDRIFVTTAVALGDEPPPPERRTRGHTIPKPAAPTGEA